MTSEEEIDRLRLELAKLKFCWPGLPELYIRRDLETDNYDVCVSTADGDSHLLTWHPDKFSAESAVEFIGQWLMEHWPRNAQLVDQPITIRTEEADKIARSWMNHHFPSSVNSQACRNLSDILRVVSQTVLEHDVECRAHGDAYCLYVNNRPIGSPESEEQCERRASCLRIALGMDKKGI